MKYRLFLFKILSYIVLYHVIFESLIVFIYKFGDPYTPIGRIYREYFLRQNLFEEHKEAEMYILSFNLFISSILFYAVNIWYENNMFVTYIKLIFMFILINIILIVFLAIGSIGMSTIPAYFLFFLVPMSIMVLLLPSLMWINKKIENIFIYQKS